MPFILSQLSQFYKALIPQRLLLAVPFVLGTSLTQANELEAYLNSRGSGLLDNLQYAVQDGIVAELLPLQLSPQESQGRCLRLMQDLGQAPLGVAVRAVVIISGLDADQQSVYSCF